MSNSLMGVGGMVVTNVGADGEVDGFGGGFVVKVGMLVGGVEDESDFGDEVLEELRSFHQKPKAVSLRKGWRIGGAVRITGV